MKHSQCWYECDREGCDAVTAPHADWGGATEIAKDGGWTIQRREYVGGSSTTLAGERTTLVDFCPAHAPAAP